VACGNTTQGSQDVNPVSTITKWNLTLTNNAVCTVVAPNQPSPLQEISINKNTTQVAKSGQPVNVRICPVQAGGGNG
jgi:hypothetical protein